MKTTRSRLAVLLGAVLLLAGCASFDTDADARFLHGRGMAQLTRFFVVSNLNDNHALDRRIAEALQARGFTADTGPLTMMPDNTQALVTYQDHWSWDFSEHLVYLKLTVTGPDSNEILAGSTFTARIPLKEPVTETVSRLVARLFDQTAPATRPTASAGGTDQRPESTKRSH